MIAGKKHEEGIQQAAKIYALPEDDVTYIVELYFKHAHPRLETLEDYEQAPDGTLVFRPDKGLVYEKFGTRWYTIGTDVSMSSLYMSLNSTIVMRLGRGDR